MVKEIEYDRITGDFKMVLDGEFVGYAATWHDAENKLDDLIYTRLKHSK